MRKAIWTLTLLIVVIPVGIGAYNYFKQNATLMSIACASGSLSVGVHVFWDFNPIHALAIDVAGPLDPRFAALYFERGSQKTPLDQWTFTEGGSNPTPFPMNSKVQTKIIGAANVRPEPIFINPTKFTLQDFTDIGACIESHFSEILVAYAEAEQRAGVTPHTNPPKAYGLVYSTPAASQREIHALNTDGNFTSPWSGNGQPSIGEKYEVEIDDSGKIQSVNGPGGNVFDPASYQYIMDAPEHYKYVVNSKGENIIDYLNRLNGLLMSSSIQFQ